jgi:hypothetical protein
MLHDDARLHTVTHSVESLRQLWKRLLYGLDLVPDYRLFGLLKDASGGRPFASDGEVKNDACVACH